MKPTPSPETRSEWLLPLALAMALVAGCSGGSSSEAPPPPPPPAPPPSSAITITAQPANQAVVSGQSASFSVVATGSGTLGYQWQINGADVAGATAVSFTPRTLTTSSDNAQITVKVSDSGGSRVSNAATLRVYSANGVPPATSTSISVHETDSGIDVFYGEHIAASNAAVSSKGRLFVFLPASASQPSRTQLILRAAADNGLHAIGLAYPNDVILELLCNGSSDASCLGNAREEIRTGAGVSSGLFVDATNSIENRLQKALLFLKQQQPAQDWGQFLDAANQPRWDRIRLSGHSQGGGHAAYIASKRTLDGACLFSSPADFDEVRQQPATWISDTRTTPASRIYGFSHQRDTVVGFTRLQTIWSALGLAAFGGATLIDGASLGDYQGRHMLYTNVASGNGIAQYHGMPVIDAATPIVQDTGVPLYAPIWQYNCFL